MADEARICRAILTAVRERGAGKTICPSEVARALSDDWRPLMPAVRQAAEKLVRSGQVIATQKGKPILPQMAKGPIRLGLPQQA